MKLNAIKQMEYFARYDPSIVSLSQGIPFRDSDSLIRAEVVESIKNGLCDKYSDPQGLLELRDAISVKLQCDSMNYSPDEIIVTAGAIEGLMATLLTILTPEKNRVIVPTPTYAAYFRAIEVAKGICLQIPLDEDQNWELDIESLKSNINDKTAAILLCNPNNPTGTMYKKETLQELAKLAKKHNFLIILDEVYKNMLYDDSSYFSLCSDSPYKHKIIRIVSFSKDFSLTGWRVGFLHTTKDLIEKILPVHDTLINCSPVVSQYAALSALRYGNKVLSENVKIYKENRALMKKTLDDLSPYLSYTLPEGSYFFFPKIRGVKNAEKFCLDLLKDTKVAVVPGNAFGDSGEGHVRICFGKSKEEIKEGMHRFSKYIKENV